VGNLMGCEFPPGWTVEVWRDRSEQWRYWAISAQAGLDLRGWNMHSKRRAIKVAKREIRLHTEVPEKRDVQRFDC
jgi:hypothetical protein